MLSKVGALCAARDPPEARGPRCPRTPQLTMPVVTGQDAKVWQKVFQELIQEVKPRHQWTLTLDKGLTPNTLQPGWAQYQQWAFAR